MSRVRTRPTALTCDPGIDAGAHDPQLGQRGLRRGEPRAAHDHGGPGLLADDAAGGDLGRGQLAGVHDHAQSRTDGRRHLADLGEVAAQLAEVAVAQPLGVDDHGHLAGAHPDGAPGLGEDPAQGGVRLGEPQHRADGDRGLAQGLRRREHLVDPAHEGGQLQVRRDLALEPQLGQGAGRGRAGGAPPAAGDLRPRTAQVGESAVSDAWSVLMCGVLRMPSDRQGPTASRSRRSASVGVAGAPGSVRRAATAERAGPCSDRAVASSRAAPAGSPCRISCSTRANAAEKAASPIMALVTLRLSATSRAVSGSSAAIA